jgi:hypothetical protein
MYANKDRRKYLTADERRFTQIKSREGALVTMRAHKARFQSRYRPDRVDQLPVKYLRKSAFIRGSALASIRG